ncbi:hypothetical protein H310_02792 [Aphanomyces invadans]|uniref:Peptidase C1A papain C-terminal domain-containing protein n=1 Tax=Aphanomyces invadans TaxID=157072 RepID=A0A024UK70_9STRA|nr:hypothetical protein H310_02792 [Aphanomyces invadans]ETW06575.1 hypothetical protein H310_02792 [Aphanomyces invadans]|eukprot:XP_008864650.1 hypothetical protein H310_02792 [Aphanomyces invadans]
MKVVETMNKPTSSPEEASLYPEEERAYFPDLKSGWLMEVDQMAVRAKLAEKVRDCEVARCGDDFATNLSKLLVRYEDIFRLTLGRDPPIDVAPLVVTLKQGAEPKPDANNFRMTVDVQVFFTLDFFKGYWQFALVKTSQEMFSFLTDTGVYTPTRVLMGGTASVARFAWIREVQERGHKLNPKKCRFYETEARWCGRIVSSAGVKYDHERIKALKELKMPGDRPRSSAVSMRNEFDAHVDPKAAGAQWRQKVAKVLLDTWSTSSSTVATTTPVSNLHEVLPPAFKKYVRENAEDATVVAMEKALGVAQSLRRNTVGYDEGSYKLRNSWGADWGEAGQIRVKRGASGKGM